MTREPYELLGVPRRVSGDDVRKAYRRLACKHHPDANSDDPSAGKRFKEIQQAHEILSDPEKRRSPRLSKLAVEPMQMNAKVSFGNGAGRKPPNPESIPMPSNLERAAA